MSKIILPTPATTGRPLQCFDFLGMLNVGNMAVSLNMIESVELCSTGTLKLIMASGYEVAFEDDEAKEFLQKLNELSEAINRQRQQQITTVPPGTRIAHH